MLITLNTTVPPYECSKHLFICKVGRFVTYPRFRFYASNALLRCQARKMSGFFISRNEEDRGLSAGDPWDLAQDDVRSLLDRARMGTHQLQGTTPYWQKRCIELNAIVLQLRSTKCIHHCTCSWSSSARIAPTYGMPAPDDPHVSASACQRHNSKSANNNPAITAWYFQKRFQLFFDHVWNQCSGQRNGSSVMNGKVEIPPIRTVSSEWMEHQIPLRWETTCVGIHSLASGINTSSFQSKSRSSCRRLLSFLFNLRRHWVYLPRSCAKDQLFSASCQSLTVLHETQSKCSPTLQCNVDRSQSLCVKRQSGWEERKKVDEWGVRGEEQRSRAG